MLNSDHLNKIMRIFNAQKKKDNICHLLFTENAAIKININKSIL